MFFGFFLDIVLDECTGADSKIFLVSNSVLKLIEQITLVILFFFHLEPQT